MAERRPGWWTRWREAREARRYRQVMVRELALRARIRRYDALVRTGLVDQAKLEVTVLANLIVEYEGGDGELARELRETVAALGDGGG